MKKKEERRQMGDGGNQESKLQAKRMRAKGVGFDGIT